jgi:hypothetical protein
MVLDGAARGARGNLLAGLQLPCTVRAAGSRFTVAGKLDLGSELFHQWLAPRAVTAE